MASATVGIPTNLAKSILSGTCSSNSLAGAGGQLRETEAMSSGHRFYRYGPYISINVDILWIKL